MWHWTPLTVSTPLSEPRRPFLIVSPSRDVDVGSPMMQASIGSPRARSSSTTAAVPIDAGALFVGRQQQCDRAAVRRHSRGEPLGGRDHRGHRHLHVRGAAAEEVSVALGRRERIARPAIDRARRHDVDVPGQADERRGRAAPRPEVADRAAIDPLAGEAGCGQARRDQLQAAVVVRRDASGRRSAASRASSVCWWTSGAEALRAIGPVRPAAAR